MASFALLRSIFCISKLPNGSFDYPDFTYLPFESHLVLPQHSICFLNFHFCWRNVDIRHRPDSSTSIFVARTWHRFNLTIWIGLNSLLVDLKWSMRTEPEPIFYSCPSQWTLKIAISTLGLVIQMLRLSIVHLALLSPSLSAQRSSFGRRCL